METNVSYNTGNERAKWQEEKFMKGVVKRKLEQQGRFIDFIVKKHLGRFDKFLLKIAPAIFVKLFPKKVRNLMGWRDNQQAYGVGIYKQNFWMEDYIDNGIEFKLKKDIDDARSELHER